ncbi:hypothetical protein LXE15_002528 [Enterococcus faecium]|nr:hypothetical protein [Enterococcus durans]EGP4752271.1 hypothetical protein [Enterococcus faecium]EGP4808696.1 hypothetical protein [Enterococcus faecium]EME3510975.1 hypothetical protein [Enterococcus faecium]EME7093103.1 hypothetical protein [Enterococcus faecium]EME8119720.1 hypothetical protein [Enterococcus faecium]
MNEKELAIKTAFIEIIDRIFENAEAYKYFLISVLLKELKSRNGRYHSFERTIEINNLTRKPIEQCLTGLYCLACHIEEINNELFDDSKGVYPIYQELMEAAISSGFFSLDELIELAGTGCINDIVENCGEFSTWNIEQSEIPLYVVVKNSYSIKGKLYRSGYQWNSSQKAWIKSFSTQEEAENEKIALWELDSEIVVSIQTRLEMLFDFDYYVVVKPQLELNQTFQVHGYRYEEYGVKKHYVKRVPTKYFFHERDFLLRLEVPFKLITPKIIHETNQER